MVTVLLRHTVPGSLKSKKIFLLQNTLKKHDQAAAVLMACFVCTLRVRSEKYLLNAARENVGRKE